MLPALWVAKTGLAAQDTNLTTISNNLANVSTDRKSTRLNSSHNSPSRMPSSA